MPSQDKKMLRPVIDQLTKAFFEVESYEMTPEQCKEAYRDSQGHPITSLVNKRKGIMRDVRAQFNAVAGINIGNNTVNRLLSYIENIKHSKRSRYCEVSLTDSPDKYITGPKFKDSIYDAVAFTITTLLNQRTEYLSEVGRPRVAVVACSPFVEAVLSERMEFLAISGFRIQLVSTLNVAFRDRVIVSLCSPSYPAGKLRVAHTPIIYEAAKHLEDRAVAPEKPEHKHPFQKSMSSGTRPARSWDTVFTGGLIYNHVMSGASMGVINIVDK